MTACPCAQELVDRRGPRAARRAGLHRRRDRARASMRSRSPPTTSAASAALYVGCPEGCDAELRAETLLRIVEESMSSEIFELMKRSDERAVVEKAHRRPRFVEDCVREMLRGVIAAYPQLDEHAFVLARQENLETIHQHNVVAERYGLLGEIRPSSTRAALAPSRDDARVAREPCAADPVEIRELAATSSRWAPTSPHAACATTRSVRLRGPGAGSRLSSGRAAPCGGAPRRSSPRPRRPSRRRPRTRARRPPAASSRTRSRRRSPPPGGSSSALPSHDAAITTPRSTATIRSIVTASSRAMITIATHGGDPVRATRARSAAR